MMRSASLPHATHFTAGAMPRKIDIRWSARHAEMRAAERREGWRSHISEDA
jgi:hypothetical protein